MAIRLCELEFSISMRIFQANTVYRNQEIFPYRFIFVKLHAFVEKCDLQIGQNTCPNIVKDLYFLDCFGREKPVSV